jgi:predicted nucleic acid-binding protein
MILLDINDCWHSLVKTHAVKGAKSHDARLVAAMQTYGIRRLLTFNLSDFSVFSITIIDPATVSCWGIL